MEKKGKIGTCETCDWYDPENGWCDWHDCETDKEDECKEWGGEF